MDVHKYWEVLHYLLCGTLEVSADNPLANALSGGESLPYALAWDVPPVLLGPVAVSTVATALATGRFEEVALRFEPEVLVVECNPFAHSSLPDQLVQQLSEEGIQPFWPRIIKLNKFYALLGANGIGVVKYVS